VNRLSASTRAVVTGAGGGLGRAFALALAEKGASVLVSDIDGAAAEETANLVEKAGGKARATRCDVRQVDEVVELRTIMTQAFGGTDLVINNAGVAVGGRIGEVAIEDWRYVVDINLMGVVHGCHVFVPELKKQGSGIVLNVASSAGLVSMPMLGPYNATKAAVVALSETMYAELRRFNVGVTALCPTFFATNIAKNQRGPSDPRDLELVEKRMRSSKLQADGVAAAALSAAERGELYCVPMLDGQVVRRVKALFPQGVARALGLGDQLRQRYLGSRGSS
jgi:NAD(P)-dependent dehydrogenase (short-subunit alcohol dehydrogenase family)